MGKKGDKQTKESELAAEQLLNNLGALSGISSKKMFGGHGIFHDGKMFGMVNSKGECFFKVDESNKMDYEEYGANKHGRMPYYSIPNIVLDSLELLEQWARKSIELSK